MIYDLVIFDCDGTLVDTEPMNKRALVELMREEGLPQYDEEYAARNLIGIRFNQTLKMITEQTGHVFPADMSRRYVERVAALAPLCFRELPGARDLLSAAKSRFKICVASNGQRDNVLLCLRLAGLMDFLVSEDVLTASEVERPKPAPDLFLLAASRFGASPQRCLVIEDSVPGVMAGAAAGMEIWGFTGAHHDPSEQGKKLMAAGAQRLFHSLIHINAALSR